jgi:hypothetical protein
MNTFFCSDNSRQVGEEIIGSGTNHQTYILVECPQPWMSEAFNSKWVPSNLKLLVEEAKQARLPIKFLLIANDITHKSNRTTLLIYQRKEGLGSAYCKQEFSLSNIEQVAPIVRKWLWGGIPNFGVEASKTRDILICSHGSHDRCCSRYGNPLYFHGNQLISELNLVHIRIWRTTHFGGHRFAPTCIDLPEGRYYGRLDIDTFRSILTRTGDIDCLNHVYRGWGILPNEIQILERELILHYGWDWFQYQVAGRIIETSADKNDILAELTFEKPDGSIYCHEAELVKDDSQTVELKSSCNASKKSSFGQYAIAKLYPVSKPVFTTKIIEHQAVKSKIA